MYGLVLAGGKSTRMGFNKAFLDFHGEPQVSWLYKLLQSLCDKVYVSGSPDKIPGDFNFMEDRYETGGPMNGILSAFNAHPAVGWLVTAVDMPNVNKDVLNYLLQKNDKRFMAACFIHPDSHTVEPFPVVLQPSCYPVLLNRFSQKNDSLNNFLQTTPVAKVQAKDAQWLININTQSQL